MGGYKYFVEVIRLQYYIKGIINASGQYYIKGIINASGQYYIKGIINASG